MSLNKIRLNGLESEDHDGVHPQILRLQQVRCLTVAKEKLIYVVYSYRQKTNNSKIKCKWHGRPVICLKGNPH